MGSLRFVARPRTFKFVGDSHAARYDGLVFVDADDPRRYVITYAHNHYGFRCSEFSDPEGHLNERLVRSLLTFNLIRGTRENAIPELGRLRTAPEPAGWEFGLRLRQLFHDQTLIVSCGEIDARDVIQRLPLDARISVAGLPSALEAGSGPTVAFDDLAADIEAEYLQPFYRGMQTLRNIGLLNLFLLAIPPPGLDDAEFEAHCGFPSRARARYGVHRMMNVLFARFCAANDIGFLDTWPLVLGPDGIVDERYHTDGIHLSRDAAIAIVTELDRRVAARTSPNPDPLL